METVFQELLASPLALFLTAVVLVHMTVMTFRSFLVYRSNKATMEELKIELRESEARVQSIMKQMDQNRNQLINGLTTLNNDLSRRMDEAKQNEADEEAK